MAVAANGRNPNITARKGKDVLVVDGLVEVGSWGTFCEPCAIAPNDSGWTGWLDVTVSLELAPLPECFLSPLYVAVISIGPVAFGVKDMPQVNPVLVLWHDSFPNFPVCELPNITPPASAPPFLDLTTSLQEVLSPILNLEGEQLSLLVVGIRLEVTVVS
jgi:hypothetical protein